MGIGSLQLRSTDLLLRGKPGRQMLLLSFQAEARPEASLAAARVTVPGGKTFEQQIAVGRNGGLVRALVPVQALREEAVGRVELEWMGERRTVEATLRPARKWKLSVSACSHTDNGFNFPQNRAQEIHAENALLAVEYVRKYGRAFVWNMEVAWHGLLAEKKRPGAMREIAREIRGGRIALHGMFAGVMTHLMHPEFLCRSFYAARALSRQHKFAVDSAIVNDIPSLCGMFPAVMAGSGIRYLAHGVNTARASGMGRYFLPPANRSPRNIVFSAPPRIWEGLDGTRIPAQYSYSYIAGSVYGLGLTANLEHAELMTAQNLQCEALNEYPFDEVYCHGVYPDNGTIGEGLPATVVQWKERYEWPKIFLCRPQDVIRRMQKRLGEKIEVIRGEGGAYWEDGAASSARETALARGAAFRLFLAEKALALGACHGPGEAWPSEAFGAAYENLWLWTEHTWGANYSVDHPRSADTRLQWRNKAAYAHNLVAEVDRLEEIARRAIQQAARAGQNEVVLFNGLSWARGGLAQVRLGEDERVADPETLEPLPQARRRDGVTRFVAPSVPALGCGLVAIVKGNRAGGRLREGTALESDFYRAEIDRRTGGIASLIDKQAGRELVDRSAAPFGQCLYVSGGDASDIAMHYPGAGKFPVELTEHTPRASRVRVGRDGDLGWVAHVEASAERLPRIRTEIAATDRLKDITITQRVSKIETFKKEALYVSFPFACAKPRVSIETPCAWMEPEKDQIPGGCREWYAVQNVVLVQDGDFGIAWSPLDTPLVCLEDINRGKWLSELRVTKGHLYAYAMNNYWNTNFKAGQGGEFVFRFRLTSGTGLSRLEALRFGWSACNPFLAARGEGASRGAAASALKSWVAVDAPSVAVVGCKKAEEGRGVMLRLWETEGACQRTTLRFARPLRKAWRATMTEERGCELAVRGATVSVRLKPKGITTVIVWPRGLV